MPEEKDILLKSCPTPEVSVLLPVFNTKEKYLRECIESILNQTFKNFELIIINDGSTNNAEDVILTYNDKRIKYFKQENQGITSVRNKMLKLEKGKYIAIADHDDISLPERLETEYNFLNNNPEYSLVSSWIEVFPKTKIWKRKPFPKYLDFLYRCEIIHPACMWQKSEFDKYNLIYEKDYYGVQDYALFSKAAKYIKCANIQKVLLKYRKHETNASRQKAVMAEETQKVQKEILEFLTSDKKLQKKIYNTIISHNTRLIHKIFSIQNYNNKKIIRILGLTFKLS